MNSSQVESRKVSKPVALTERNRFVDALRGFAVLGILLFNILFYVGVSGGLAMPSGLINRLAVIFIRFFIEAKFYSLFSLLFGWGLAVQMRRQKGADSAFVIRYVKRLLILLFFGVLHGVFIWFGDILTLYAVLGFLLLLFRRRSSKFLLVSAIVALLFSIFLILPLDQVESFRSWYLNLVSPLRLDRYPESLYISGSFLEATRRRLQDFLNGQLHSIFAFGNVFAMFLLGLALGKEAVFSNLNQAENHLTKLTKPIVITAVVLNSVYVAVTFWPELVPTENAQLIRLSARTIGAPALTLTYILGLAWLFKNQRWKPRILKLAPVGQMALTNYISHSVLCTLFFYGYGLGMYGRIAQGPALLLALIIYSLQIRWSEWWLDRYRFGPLEWIWRTGTYKFAPPMRRTWAFEPEEVQEFSHSLSRQRWATVSIWLVVIIWFAGLVTWSHSMREESVNSGALLSAIRRPDMGAQAVTSPAYTEYESAVIEKPLTEPILRDASPLVLDGDLMALAATFDVDSALEQVEIFAQDEYAGRLAASLGGWAAGEHIASAFNEFGLQPAGEEGGFFQYLPVDFIQLADVPRLTVSTPDTIERTTFRLHQEFNVFSGDYAGAGMVSGPVVWGNFCDHSDFDEISVVGAVVLCRSDPEVDFDRHAIEHGAAGVLLIVDPDARPLDFAVPFRESIVPTPLPVFRVTSEVVDTLIDSEDLSRQDLLLTYEARELSSSVTMHVALSGEEGCAIDGCLARNVLGVIPGRDPEHADEVVIISAHYDHMGSAPDGTFWPGANDDASGVGILLEIARSWHEEGYVPRRTVLFAAWDAEELGLFGSRHYVQKPSYPLEETVAVLQLDMVGAGGPILRVDGRGGFTRTVMQAAEAFDTEVLQTELGRSDHVAFWEAGIPGTLLIWHDPDGAYVDYHRPIDDIRHIDLDALESAGMISHLALLAKVEVEPQIDQLLADRAQAIQQQDQELFVKGIHPAQWEYEQAWFQSLQGVDIVDVEFELHEFGLHENHASGQVLMSLTYRTTDPSLQERVISTEYPIRFTQWTGSWVWAGPELVEVPPEGESGSYGLLPIDLDIFMQDGIDLNLDQGVLPALEYMQETANLLGLNLPEKLRLEIHSQPEGFPFFVELESEISASVWVNPGVIKVFGTSQARSVSELKPAFLELLLYESGLQPDIVPWLWRGLPIALEVQSNPQEYQSRYLTDLYQALFEDAALDADVAAWAAVEDQRVNTGWGGIGRIIRSLGQRCQRGDCADESQQEGVYLGVFGMRQEDLNAAWVAHWTTRFERITTGIQETLDSRSEAVAQTDLESFLETVDHSSAMNLAEQSDYFMRLKSAGIQEICWEPVVLAIQSDGTILARVMRISANTGGEGGGHLPDQRGLIHFVPDRSGYLWADPHTGLKQDGLVSVLYPAQGEALAEEILGITAPMYSLLSTELGLDLPSELVIKVYQEETGFRSSIPLTTDEETPGIWTSAGQSIKLLIPSEGDLLEDIRPQLIKSITRKLLVEAGIEEEWFIRGMSSAIAPELDARARLFEATRYLWRISSASKRDQLLPLLNLPGDERLDEEQRKVANAQSWDAVSHLMEKQGMDTIRKFIAEVQAGMSFDESFRSVFGYSQDYFSGDWFEGYSRAHTEQEWLETVEGFDGVQAFSYVTELAGREYGGRKPGSEGERLAADYIAREFELYGLKPVVPLQIDPLEESTDVDHLSSLAAGADAEDIIGPPLTYFQDFSIYYVPAPQAVELRIEDPFAETVKDFIFRENFLDVPIVVGNLDPVRGELIWVNGETYPSVDLSGKIVLRYASTDLETDVREADARGVAGLILVNQNRTNRGFLRKWAVPVDEPTPISFPVLQLSQQGFEDFIDVFGMSLTDFTSELPVLRLGLNAEVNLSMDQPEQLQTANVLGLLPGSDPELAQEIVVLGAHYDHVGDDPLTALCHAGSITEAGTHELGDCESYSGYRFPGSNDDASGVAVMLELARLWSKTDYRPARSVLFAAWTAQESGQIGSTYYVENPIFPLEQTWAMIQLDAVGGGRGYCLDASGVFEQDGLLIGRTAILQDLVDARVNMNQKPLNETIRPSMSQWLQWPEDDHIEESDHLSFRNVGIPSLLLRWCGAEETNEPLGESDTVLPERLEVTGRVVSLLVMTLAR